MSKKVKLAITGGVIFIVLIALVSMYNGLVNTQEDARTAWSEVENQLQRRNDLIPNYVKIVQGYAKHEKELLVAVTEARAEATKVQITVDDLEDPEKFQKFQEAQNKLQGVLGRLMMIHEKYPDLKANENFLKLQDELAGTENRIAVARGRYNKAAAVYNKKLRSFPHNFFKGFGDFKRMPLFKAEEGADKAPEISFD